MVGMDDIRNLMDVNVIGLMAATKACLPLLRAGRGRIVNISSGHGLLAIPDKSVYAASKFAVQAVSDSLRVELRPFGISVSSLVVGKVDTAVLGKIKTDRQAMLRKTDPRTVDLYSPLIEYFDSRVKDLPAISPNEVARVVAESLTTSSPKARYLIGPGARKMRNLSLIPVRLRDWMLAKALYSGRSA
jgi:short-subunit dehydrogenase